jgi:hypothetical protein
VLTRGSGGGLSEKMYKFLLVLVIARQGPVIRSSTSQSQRLGLVTGVLMEVWSLVLIVARQGHVIRSSRSQSQSLGLFTVQIVIRNMFGIIHKLVRYLSIFRSETLSVDQS